MMRLNYGPIVIVIAVALWRASAAEANDDRYTAFSLRVAENALRAPAHDHSAIRKLASMTDPMCVIYDQNSGDLILVGRANYGDTIAHLDDFATALRAVHKNHMWPLVSIDRTEQTGRTGQQDIRFEAGIHNTAFGKALLDADIILKKLGLGLIKAKAWGVNSYFDLARIHCQQTGDDDAVRSRIWYKTGTPVFVSRKGVAAIKDLDVIVATDVLASGSDSDVLRDEPGELFARQLTQNHREICDHFQEIERLNTLFRWVGLCAAVSRFAESDPGVCKAISYWLSDYPVEQIETLEEYPLLVREEEVDNDGRARRMTMDGGIELRAKLLDLKDGSVTALKDIVLGLRPHPNSLVWAVPLQGWSGMGDPENESPAIESLEDAGDMTQQLGCTFTTSITSPFSPLQSEVVQSAPQVQLFNGETGIGRLNGFNYLPLPEFQFYTAPVLPEQCVRYEFDWQSPFKASDMIDPTINTVGQFQILQPIKPIDFTLPPSIDLYKDINPMPLQPPVSFSPLGGRY